MSPSPYGKHADGHPLGHHIEHWGGPFRGRAPRFAERHNVAERAAHPDEGTAVLPHDEGLAHPVEPLWKVPEDVKIKLNRAQHRLQAQISANQHPVLMDT